MKLPQHILPTIVFSQFCGTSLWFSSNAVMSGIVSDFGLEDVAMAHLTTAVQFGFISGTLAFALLSIADRFSPSRVFMISTLVGSLFNLGMVWEENTLASLLFFRFMTGFFLAGIYPVGMKIAADHYDKGLGRSLGFLVGALVLGTAFPHILRDAMANTSWKNVIVATSILATIGGSALLLFVPNGPFRKAGTIISVKQIAAIFKDQDFKKAAFGYFGHMWELYTFWALVPVLLITYNALFPEALIEVGLYSFSIIGIGALGCVFGGILSERFGVQKIARYCLWLSALCCLVSPAFFFIPFSSLMITFLCFWGMVVIADSPLFSTLVAQKAASATRGTALTIVTSIGFAVTIVSLQLYAFLQDYFSIIYMLPLLATGPLFGLLQTRK